MALVGKGRWCVRVSMSNMGVQVFSRMKHDFLKPPAECGECQGYRLSDIPEELQYAFHMASREHARAVADALYAAAVKAFGPEPIDGILNLWPHYGKGTEALKTALRTEIGEQDA